MNRSKLIGVAAGGWLAAEIVAFYIVAHALGLFAAILLGVATSVFGLADVKRLLLYWRAGSARADGATLDSSLQALGALLLILPGFASDFVGLALKSPSFRAAVAGRLRGRSPSGAPGIVDLAPHEWKNVTRGKGKTRTGKSDQDATRSAPCP